MKVNRGFISYLDYMGKEAFNYSDDPQYNPNKQSRLLGGFQPLFDIEKDIRDTFKPYKSTSYYINDILQPLIGFKNSLKGIGYVLLPFVIRMIDEPPSDITWSWFIFGISNIVRGISQIITTPLTWFLRLPLRHLLTCFSNKPIDFEQRESIQILIHTAEGSINAYEENRRNLNRDLINEAGNICLELHRKFKNSTKMNKPTSLSSTEEQSLFDKINLVDYGNHGNPCRMWLKKADVIAYLAFFKPASPRANHIGSNNAVASSVLS